MAAVTLKIGFGSATKTMQFDPTMLVQDVCHVILEKLGESMTSNSTEFGLFLCDTDVKKGVWLEGSRSLEFYLLRNGDYLEYRNKLRVQKIRTMEGSVKTARLDDSMTVEQLMPVICGKLGVSNPEEYSMIKELDEEELQKTLTMKREKSIARDQKKLDEMKRKLHTEDDVNWLDHSRTLRDQDIEEGEELLLKRKFFFSDSNVDARDPVQLSLLYVQCRDGILQGTHPVTQDEAVQFAGLSCQAQISDFTEGKKSSIDVKTFLPREYQKMKGVEKKIVAEHKKFQGWSELQAKVKYVQLCRALKTYGIAFFLVKEKMKGKNKLVPRLLGINKEGIVRMDEKTKEILQTWQMTTVKRWAPSAHSFTLDFGEYADAYYCCQTTDGEQIAQLLAGYIDIIVKKRKAKDHLGLEGDEESTMWEDTVTPAKATIIQQQSNRPGQPVTGDVALPGVIRPGSTSSLEFATAGNFGRGQQPKEISQFMVGQNAFPRGDLSAVPRGIGGAEPRRAYLTTIGTGLEAMDRSMADLGQKADLPPLGDDISSKKWKANQLDLSKQNIQAELSAMNAATAQVVTLTEGQETDYTLVGSAVSTITSNMGELTKDVRMLAALEEDEDNGNRLLDATRGLAAAFSHLMTAAQPQQKEGGNQQKQQLLQAADKVGQASHDVIKRTGETPSELEKKYEDTLLNLARAVANATANLVLKAKGVASGCQEPGLRNGVIDSATKCGLATSQLIACVRVVAPTIGSPACQEQVVESARHVARNVEAVVGVSNDACEDEGTLNDLSGAASSVDKALSDLLLHIRAAGNRGGRAGRESVGRDEVDAIETRSEALLQQRGDGGEMVKQAAMLAQATTMLVNSMRSEADQVDDGKRQQGLLDAARGLADATSRLVDAAKGCAGSPGDSGRQESLKQAAEDVVSATRAATVQKQRRHAIQRLEIASKNAAAAATHVVNASRGAEPSNTSANSQQHLNGACRDIAEVVPRLVQSIKGTMNQPGDAEAQLHLINVAQAMVEPSVNLSAAAKSAAPTVGDPSAATALTGTTRGLDTSVEELQTAILRAKACCGPMDSESAVITLGELRQELADIERASRAGALQPLPGDHAETAAHRVAQTSKTVGSTMAQLLTAALQGEASYVAGAARDMAEQLRSLLDAVRGVAATAEDPAVAADLFAAYGDVLTQAEALVVEAQRSLAPPGGADNQQQLALLAKQASQALSACVSALPGQRHLDEALRGISVTSQRLTQVPPSSSGRPYAAVQQDLTDDAAKLNESAAAVVSASQASWQHLSEKSTAFNADYDRLVDSGLELAAQTEEREAQGQVIGGLRNVSTVSSKLLLAAKSMHADPSAPNAKNNLTQAARGVTESINALVNICTESAPGQKECDSVNRQLQTLRDMLVNPTEPVTDLTYFQCLDEVMDRSKDLAESMRGIADSGVKSQSERFCENVQGFGGAISRITEAAAHAAYLVGIAEAGSEPGRPGLVDQAQFARAIHAMQTACESLANPTSTQQQVHSLAAVIAKHTTWLCNMCRAASQKTANPVARRRFVQSAKEVATNTADLVKAINELDRSFTEDKRGRCREAAQPLLTAVEDLRTFAFSPEFASSPAKMSPKAREAQEPITSAGLELLTGACSMVEAAKVLAVNAKDMATYQRYSKHSHTASQAIKTLIANIRECAPGQLECEGAIERLRAALRQLDEASVAAVGGGLPARADNNMVGFQERMSSCVKEVTPSIDDVRNGAKGEPEKLGHAVTKIADYVEPLTDSAVGCAAKTEGTRAQAKLLDRTRTAVEAALQLVYAAKEGGGNPKATNTHQAIDDTADSMKEALTELNAVMEDQASASGIVTSIVDNVQQSIALAGAPKKKVPPPVAPKPGQRPSPEKQGPSSANYQTEMVRLAQQLARTSQDMVVKSGGSGQELGPLAQSLSNDYSQLSRVFAAGGTPQLRPEYQERVQSHVQALGRACISLVKDAGTQQMNPGDAFTKRELADHAGLVGDQVSQILSTLQESARGTQACIAAENTISGIIADLDTTVMFASAGTLNTDRPETFTDHREGILKSARALVSDTQELLRGAAGSQGELAEAAGTAAATISHLSTVVKAGAASLGPQQPDAQVLLLTAVKDVAAALSDLINSTKNAAGKGQNDPAMTELKDSAQVMVKNVKSLLRTVKTVEDEATRGTHALEAAIEAIGQEMKHYDASQTTTKTATAEELMACTRLVTSATSRAVNAANSAQQDGVIAAANMGRKAVGELLVTCKAAAQNAETPEDRTAALRAGRACAAAYRELLERVSSATQRPGAEARQAVAASSRNVATVITDLVDAAEALKGSEWVDPTDPIVVAETELLGAANAIEAAARKLAALQPRQEKQAPDADLPFEGQLLEAAKSIAAATAALVKCASAAQRELVSQGRVRASFMQRSMDEDGQWSHGLISAARMVAAATQTLCEAAHALVQGTATEERLIAASRQVAASTAQLLVACKVKTDSNSQAMRKLTTAGNAVKRATEALVEAARQSQQKKEEAAYNVKGATFVPIIKQELEMTEEILRKERELTEARKRLGQIRKKRYEVRPQDSDDEDEAPPQ